MFGNPRMRNQATSTPRRSSDASDVALLGRVAEGNLRAFETLYRIYHPRLDRFLGLMTSRRTVVEEALNDTMLVVWNRPGSYNRQSKVSTWIFAIAYRTALKALRKGATWSSGETLPDENALAEWLKAHRRSAFLLTAPPLRLPGAVGSPACPIATV